MPTLKTHKSALVIIPPYNVWEPIQTLRQRYDRKVRRWMPHITLLYPFYPVGSLPPQYPKLQQLCARWRPFLICLRRFQTFYHGQSRYTLWLAPEPDTPLRTLQQDLQELFPECTEQSRYSTGFTPHLSIGQYRGPADEVERLRAELERWWLPVHFLVDAVVLVTRDDPPNDVFYPVRTLPFGNQSPELAS
ncbi:MAG: 2'-5' RNA ligase family protein [Candidatus Kapabacteria bacterium]|nr:2'-5' RNA ligase family protein [Candidatus Kapabacteria bacterium]MCS7169526.1 2'-5' RNA ligase family protein [Candidatus Kapabacteria bacterium]MDW7997639.1 2'-5' RNA ligase family protein [Bacteroidota bacterium]MDW8224630.1 2'-5' RNA ligase family protein [Bacteroidota bacterium]